MLKYALAASMAVFFLTSAPDKTIEEWAGFSLIDTAEAEPMGREGWNFASRNRTTYSQYQFLRQEQGTGTAGGGDGLGTLNQYVTNYNSSSTAIGNYSEINQILGDGAQGYLALNNKQKSTGSQTSDADTQVSIDNSTAIADGDGAHAEAGSQDNGNNPAAPSEPDTTENTDADETPAD
mgnify:CR=1 FL=1